MQGRGKTIFLTLLPIAVINEAQNEELPKTVTEILKQQIERTAQEKAVHSDRETATPAKELKVCAFNKRDLSLCKLEVVKLRRWSIMQSEFLFWLIVIKTVTYESGGNIWTLGIKRT